jgi:hypothetical protein
MAQGIEVIPNRSLMVTARAIYKVPHDEFFRALQSKAFRGLRVLQCVDWEADGGNHPFYKRRNPADYLKLTVYLSNVLSANAAIDTQFSYLARKVHMERAQRRARVVIAHRSKPRTLAFCMATHPRLGQGSLVQMPHDVLRAMHVAHGLIRYIGA